MTAHSGRNYSKSGKIMEEGVYSQQWLDYCRPQWWIQGFANKV